MSSWPSTFTCRGKWVSSSSRLTFPVSWQSFWLRSPSGLTKNLFQLGLSLVRFPSFHYFGTLVMGLLLLTYDLTNHNHSQSWASKSATQRGQFLPPSAIFFVFIFVFFSVKLLSLAFHAVWLLGQWACNSKKKKQPKKKTGKKKTGISSTLL